MSDLSAILIWLVIGLWFVLVTAIVILWSIGKDISKIRGYTDRTDSSAYHLDHYVTDKLRNIEDGASLIRRDMSRLLHAVETKGLGSFVEGITAGKGLTVERVGPGQVSIDLSDEARQDKRPGFSYVFDVSASEILIVGPEDEAGKDPRDRFLRASTPEGIAEKIREHLEAKL